MTKKETFLKIEISLIKKVLFALLYIAVIPGIYLAAKRFHLTSKLSLIASALAALFFLSLIIIGFIYNRKGQFRRYIIFVMLVLSVGLILINIVMLRLPYLKPHNSTTIMNRHYPKSLMYTHWIDNYTQDKVVYVAQNNDYIDGDYKDYSPVDYSNIVSLLSSAKSIEVLDDVGYLNGMQVGYLYEQENKYFLIDEEYVKNRFSYFYIDIDVAKYNEVVFMQDSDMNVYFMPYEIYMKISDLG